MAAKKAKISKRVVDTLKPGETVWDTEIAGFGIRCQTRDKVYILKKRINGRQRWLTIGKHGEPFTADLARDEALILLGDIKKGNDPALEREKRKNQPTVANLMQRYLEEHAFEHKKASSAKEDEANIRNHIVPHLGNRQVIDLTVSDIDALKRAIKAGGGISQIAKDEPAPRLKGGPGAANRCLALLSKAMNLAIKWGWRADNPVSHVSKYKENKIERFLSETEIAAIAGALRKAELDGASPYAIAAIRLLMFTGARRGEILTLKWSEVHFDKDLILLGDSKTGAKPIYLNAPAKDVLAGLPKQKDNPYVICGTNQGKHLTNLKRLWQNVRNQATLDIWANTVPALNEFLQSQKETPPAQAISATARYAKKEGLELPSGVLDVRIHDLRHTFASVGAMGGLSLHMIGKLLGHKQAGTTQRYAHLADNPILDASNKISAKLADCMNLDTLTAKTEIQRG
ncbi:MAG: tyrosine-type recombinase/integrase [Alphaproteobacteria bacterium]|nr:tyrosine-type recombinase/integrase [Alphaproteobacteria bacterium]